jgi:hypothetical protein
MELQTQKNKSSVTITSNYIPSPEYWKEMFRKYPMYSIKEQVPVSEIKINRALFDFNNEVRHGDVDYMCSNFELDAWMPITVSEKLFLLDGQHRLACAKKMGLKYIDAIVLAVGGAQKAPNLAAAVPS